LCLDNGEHYSLAGKHIQSSQWFRPVSAHETGALQLDQLCYEYGGQVQLLDILRLPLECHQPEVGQPENCLIGSSGWQKVGEYPLEELPRLCDDPESLWMEGCSWSRNNILLAGCKNDRVNYYELLTKDYVKQSLYLIRPSDVSVTVSNLLGTSKVRAVFEYNGIDYDLAVTDPEYLSNYKSRYEGSYPLSDDTYLTISLGRNFHGYCYKLVAAIFEV
jgi:hypothetical protein